jgi:hypothetical protein
VVRNIKAWPKPLAGVDPAVGTRQPLIVTPDFKQPTGMQWNFGIERQLGNAWVAKVSYLGNRGVNIVGIVDQVQPPVSTDAQGNMFTPQNTPNTNPFLDSTRTYASIGDSIYNSLQLQLQKKMSYGLQFSASYTYSKNISDVGVGLKNAEQPSSGGGGGGSFQIGNLWNYKQYDRSRADQDAPHNVVINYTYELPIGTGHHFGGSSKKVNMLLGGWQLNGVFSGRSGLPLTLTGGGYNVNTYCKTCVIRPNLKPGGDNNPVTGDINHWFDETQFDRVAPGYFGTLGKNTVSGPRLIKMDFSLFKRFDISESKNVQFRAEFFNLPNHPNFGSPAGAVFNTDGTVSATVGRITQTLGNPRQIQLALKFEF